MSQGFSEKTVRKTPLLSPEALDFAPGLLAIQESPPARLPRAVLYSVSGLFLILLTWACIGKLDIVASAEGRLVPESYVKVVQPADAGIVEEILVKEGQKVSAGEVLLRMDTHEAQADSTTVQTQLTLKSLQLRRIDAELTGKTLKLQPGDPADLFAEVDAQYRDRKQSYLDSVSQAQETLLKSQRQYDAGVQVLSKLQETNPLLKAQNDAYEDMGIHGYASRVVVRDKQREYLENTQDLHAQESTVESLKAAVAESQKQISQLTSKYRSDLQNERVDTETQYRKLEQDWAKQEHKTGLLELKAPQSGVVKDLAIHTIGTVVTAGSVLLSLVPENEPLLADVLIKNEDVGFVYAQQRVKVKVTAYPFQKYGMLEGQVIHIGPDANDDASSSPSQKDRSHQSPADPAQQLNYKAQIALNSQTLVAQGESFKLVPGMQVIAEIDQGRRTVMDYLLSPIEKTLFESGRER